MRSVAHDIRSPLTNIKGYADAMRDGTFPAERIDSSLALISDESDRLARLCSRLSADMTELSPADFGICDLCASVLLMLDGVLREKSVCVEYDYPDDEIYVRADRDAVHEAVYNILSNAAKYTGDGGIIKISARSDENQAKISVSNTFSGQTPDKQRIFSPGYRASDAPGGNGLGLYVAAEIIKSHTREPEVLFEDGVCTFTFTLDKADETQTNVL